MTTLYNEYEVSQSESSLFSLPPPYPLPPAEIIRTSLPFATYYLHPSSHQPLNPVQHPPSSTYHYMQEPHSSPFQVIQTRESIAPKTAVIGQIEITPHSTPNKENQIARLSGERRTALKPEKRTSNWKPECKQQKQRRSSSAKKQIKPAFELEINDVTILSTAEERLVLQIRDNVELYESNGQLTFEEMAQLHRAIITYLLTFLKPSLTNFENSNLTVHSVHSVIQIIYAAKQHPAPEQLGLETEQPGSQVDKKSHYISKDIGKALEVYWTIVRPSFISAKVFSKKNLFSYSNPLEKNVSLQQTREGNEVFRPLQVFYETKNALESFVEDELEKQRDLRTRKTAKLIPVSHNPRARIPSISVLVIAITHLFDEKIPGSTITDLVSFDRVPFAALETTLEQPPISLHAHIKKRVKERALRNSQRSRCGSK